MVMPPVPTPRKRYKPAKIFGWNVEAELDLMRQFCRSDFWTFFLYGFGASVNPKGNSWIEPSVHEPIARWYQKHIDEWMEDRRLGRIKQKHLAFVIHREVGKTTMIPMAGQLWLHLRDPELSSYTGGEKTDHAMITLRSIKAVIDGSDPYAMFPKLYGRWDTAARTWKGSEIVHSARKNTSRRDPSFGTFGVETSIVGAHPDAIFYDDPISLDRLKSDANWLETVNNQVTSLYPVIQSDGLIVWTGTRYSDRDHFGRAFDDEGVATLSGMETDSIRPSEGGKWHVYFMCGRDREGRPSTPKRWPAQRLDDFMRRDPAVYAGQVMNDPNLSEFNPITLEQINQCWIDAKEVPWGALRFAITTDTAFFDGSRRIAKDESVWMIHGYPRNGSGDVYVVEGDSSPYWRAEQFGEELVRVVQRYRGQGRKIFAITDEVTMAGKKDAWRIALQNIFHDAGIPMPPFHQFDRRGQKKINRISTVPTFWIDGHVRLVKGGPNLQRLVDQMKKIGQMQAANANNRRSSIKDDWVDAHADAFQPELYQPMRRAQYVGRQNPPWERDSELAEIPGLDTRAFMDDEISEWMMENPRPPIR